MIDTKTAGKAIIIGVAGAVLLIVANGLYYVVDDLLPQLPGIGWSLGSSIASFVGTALYPFSVVLGLVLGGIIVAMCRKENGSLKSLVIAPAVAGLALGLLTFFARVIYELVFRPLVTGYSVSPMSALAEVITAGTDVVMMAGLIVAGAAICAAFIIKLELR